MNPSTADLLAAVEATAADEVVLLPNNSNVVLAAEQAARVAGKPVQVVPTESIPAGLAALVAFNGERSADENAAAMREALAGGRDRRGRGCLARCRERRRGRARGRVPGAADGKVVEAAPASTTWRAR